MVGAVKLPPVVHLLFGFGAGLATGLARFPDPRVAIPALLVAAALVRQRAVPALLAGAALLGQGSAIIAWQGESARCTVQLRPGPISLTLLPVDPPAVSNGRVQALVPGAGCVGAVDVRWPTQAGGPGSRLASVQIGVPVEEIGRAHV